MTIETSRLLIRPTTYHDVDTLYELLRDEETMKFFVEGPYSKEKVKELINRNRKETHHFTVLLKSSHRIIGKISYNPWLAPKTKEIGWVFFQTATKNGYCTEAAVAIIKHDFEQHNTHRIVAMCDPLNIASKRVCEKLHMRLEGTFKSCIQKKDGTWVDELFYALLEEEYNKE